VKPTRAKRAAAGGFTLVEVLVSLTILSMVLALLFTSLRMGGRSLQAVELQTEQAEKQFQSQRLLRDLLEQIDPYMLQDAGGRKTLVFTGERARLEFVAPASRSLGWSGLLNYRLELVDSAARPGKVDLVMSYWPTAIAEEPQGQELVIMTATRDSRFSYFGRNASGQSAWQAQWRNPEYLPEVISLTHGEQQGAGAAPGLPPDLYVVTRTSWYGQNDQAH